MNHVLRHAVLAAATLAAALPITPARAGNTVCVPQAIGVPSRPGAPQWNGSTGLTETALDDPRWLGATGHAIGTGAALSPMQSRMLWTQDGTQQYLLMSFIVDLDNVTTSTTTSARDVFVGFHRKTALNVGSGNDEYGYVFQFHLSADATGGPVITPTSCTSVSGCADQNYWRVFVDRHLSADCSTVHGTIHGPSFLPYTDPVPWVTTGTTDVDALRYWKLGAGNPLLLQNRWAVQVRIKMAASDTAPLSDGIPLSSTLWYQGTAQLTTDGDFGAIGWFPHDLTDSVCVKASSPNQLVHPQLGDAAQCAGSSDAAACSLDFYRPIKLFSGARPADCEGGLFIDTPYIGSFPLSSSFNPATDWPGDSFKANDTNVVVAQVTNKGTADVDVPLLARFRLAQWGSAPWVDPTQHGVWQDIPAAAGGVCGTAPASPGGACGLLHVPKFVDADSDGRADNRAVIKFNWKIGTDPKLGASEFCKYGLKPPDVGGTVGTCTTTCTCAASDPDCDTGTGVRANVPSTPTPACVSTKIQHQCMFVELSSQAGNADFAQQSSWNNMNFDQMSTVSREALIDARQLPTKPGQTDQDIFLVAMARNMPSTIPATTGGNTAAQADGGLFIRERIMERAEALAAPYLADLQRVVIQVSRQAAKPEAATALASLSEGKGGPGDSFRPRITKLLPALQIMPKADQTRVTGLLVAVLANVATAQLNEQVVNAVGPAEAALVLPTLEIYPFYRRYNVGPALVPMTSFTVILGHDGGLSGIDWRIDGADQVSQNVYHLKVPVGYARKIQVRAQAVQPPEAPLGPAQPKWPCSAAGGCAGCGGARNCGLVSQVGGTFPALIAGMLVVRRRRRKH